MKTKLFVLIFCGLSILNAQLKESYYSLSRMNYEDYVENKLELVRSLKSSTCKFNNMDFTSWSFTTGIFSINKTTYHIIANSWTGNIYPGDDLTIKIINTSTGKEERLTSYAPSQFDAIFSYRPANSSRVMQTAKGFLIYNFPSNLAVMQKDTLSSVLLPADSNKVFSQLIGEISDKYLVACDTSHTTIYFIEDFDTKNEPSFNKKINVVGAKLLDKIYLLQDSLYFISAYSGNGIAKFSKDTISVVHLMIDREIYSYRANRLYYRTNYGDSWNGLAKQEYDKTKREFLPEKKILFGSHISAIDAFENYYVTLKSDTLMVYSFAKDSLIFKKKIQPPTDVREIFIDPPYVYFEHFDRTVGIESEQSLPDKFSLSQNYPNPFNPETVISYKLQAASNVSLKVYDVLGREIATLVNEFKQAGTHNCKLRIENGELTSGIYFYRLQSGSYSETKKLVLLK